VFISFEVDLTKCVMSSRQVKMKKQQTRLTQFGFTVKVISCFIYG